jgi:hypothetical protein
MHDPSALLQAAAPASAREVAARATLLAARTRLGEEGSDWKLLAHGGTNAHEIFTRLDAGAPRLVVGLFAAGSPLAGQGADS